MKTPYLLALAVLIIAQLAVPFGMIRSRETVLRDGELFRFKTQPIDPADPFQGRYVRLGFSNRAIPLEPDPDREITRATTLYALIENDADGFAYFSEARLSEPETADFLKTRPAPFSRFRQPGEIRAVTIDIPFDRFYMDETLSLIHI